jgi:ubiquinone/menaquinone biosynthesis C-methylase UbiE
MAFWERRLFGESHRDWACSKAAGRTLEVAVGTGLNLSRYPREVNVTGIDLSSEMLAIARTRATGSSLSVDLREGDAHALAFEDDTFDTVVSTYSLCNIPDTTRAIGEMKRVLKPHGRLVLVDHVGSESTPVLWVQKAVEFFSIRLQGEHMTRRPLDEVARQGFEILERERFGFAGMVERGVALKRADG